MTWFSSTNYISQLLCYHNHVGPVTPIFKGGGGLCEQRYYIRTKVGRSNLYAVAGVLTSKLGVVLPSSLSCVAYIRSFNMLWIYHTPFFNTTLDILLDESQSSGRKRSWYSRQAPCLRWEIPFANTWYAQAQYAGPYNFFRRSIKAGSWKTRKDWVSGLCTSFPSFLCTRRAEWDWTVSYGGW